MRARSLALLLALLALTPATPALADDAAVRDAYNAKDAELLGALKARTKTQNRWVNSGFNKVGPYLKALRRVREVAGQIRRGLGGTEASTDIGSQARQAGIGAFDALEGSVGQAIGSAKNSTAAVNAYANGKRAKGNRLRNRAKRQANKSGKLAAKSARLTQKASDLFAQLAG